MRRPFPSLSDQIHRSFHADGSGNSNVSYPEIPETVSAWVQGPYAHQIGKPLPLDARGSYSTRGDLVTYEWDLDGDGISDERDPHETAQHRSKHQPRPQHGTDSHPHAVGPVCTDR